MSPKVCRCHGVVMLRSRRQWNCVVKRRVSNKLAARRYRATANGKAHTHRNNVRRIYIGKRAVTHAATFELAQAINTHVRSAVRAFVHRSQEDSVLASQ